MSMLHQGQRMAAKARAAAAQRYPAVPQSGPALIQPPVALNLLYQGIAQLAEPLAHTLGPSQRMVMNARSSQEVEMLNDSATIAKRIYKLPDRRANVGAMMLRNTVERLHEHYGDGAATAAVFAQAILRTGIKYVAAGHNPAMMRQGIERAIAITGKALKAQAIPVEGQEMLARLAVGVTGDYELGQILGEMFDMLGENAALITEENTYPRLDREYISGGQWTAVPGERSLIPEGQGGLELQRPLIMLVDEELKTVEQVQPALEQALAFPDKPPLLIIARDVSGDALNALTINHTRGVMTIAVAILKTGILLMTDDMGDIAALTGGEVLANVKGYPPERMQASFFGRARKATLTRNKLIIADGAGDKRAIRQRLKEVRAEMARTPRSDGDWKTLRIRTGRLSGGIGVVKIGAYTEQERDLKKEQLDKALRALDAAQEEGIIPGGGAAFLDCIPAVLEAQATYTNPDEAAGMAIVASALTAPFVQIISNHGRFHPPIILDEVRRRGPGHGFDVLTGDYALMAKRGIMDSISVSRAALEAGASVATMALTTDAIVLI